MGIIDALKVKKNKLLSKLSSSKLQPQEQERQLRQQQQISNVNVDKDLPSPNLDTIDRRGSSTGSYSNAAAPASASAGLSSSTTSSSTTKSNTHTDTALPSALNLNHQTQCQCKSNTHSQICINSLSQSDDISTKSNIDAKEQATTHQRKSSSSSSSSISPVGRIRRNTTAGPFIHNQNAINNFNADTIAINRKRSYSTSTPNEQTQGAGSQLISQSDESGNLISISPTVLARRGTARGRQPGYGTGRLPPNVNATIEELHPSSVTPRYKPNDVILVYRDLSELASAMLGSVTSGFRIMSKDTGNFRRRALHEESMTHVNGTSYKLDTTRSITKMQERNERSNLVLWWKPFYTLWYFILECKCLLLTYLTKLWHNRGKLFVFLVFLAGLTVIYNIDGQHQKYVASIEKQVLWYSYWVVLGIMSSVGLGTGLHTFVLYLGPFIASVTLAAYECKSLDFPEPPYPTRMECPKGEGSAEAAAITLWSIMSKVRIESMMWGAGTAIGELPPYFMARAAKLSGTEDEIDDDDIEEVLDIEEKERSHPSALKELGIVERTKVYMHDMVHKVGFFGILACASIPNPLFDLAGITCGHFLVPFWTFFGATLIGKAVIKMHIQKLVVIFTFSEHHVEVLIKLLKSIPKIGDRLGDPINEYLTSQRAKLHSDSSHTHGDVPWLAWVFEKLIIVMVMYFVISIINSFAQSYHKRLCVTKRKQLEDVEKLH